MHTQSLSFGVRIARTRSELQAACRVRALSYGHHVPQLRATLLEPDLLDADENTIVVLCVDKASGEAVGTARFQTNAGGPLLIEHSMTVPEEMRNDTRAEITRLSAVAGADPLVKLCLMKASYLFCLATQVRWMVICARSDALLRQYRRLGFAPVFDDGHMLPMLHVGRLDHHVLTFNVTTAESRWREAQHPLYDFMIETAHPDIQLLSNRPALPRRESSGSVEQIRGWSVGATNVSSAEQLERPGSRAALIN
ncbi:MAG: hypothetical protein ABI809_01590 [Caldimonas sp.]